MVSLHNKKLKKKSVSVILQERSGEGWFELIGMRVVCIHGQGSDSASSSSSVVCSQYHLGHISIWFILNTVQYSIT